MARRFLLLLFVVGLTTMASAVKIETSDPDCPVTKIGPGQTINFTVEGGGGIFCFENDTGSDWTNLLVAIDTTIPADQIDCVTSDFKACQLYTSDQPDAVYAFFYGTCISSPGKKCIPSDILGVPNGGEITFNLNCDSGCGVGSPYYPPDWSPGTGGTGYYDVPTGPGGDPVYFPPVPEPVSATLLASGLGAIYLRRKRS